MLKRRPYVGVAAIAQTRHVEWCMQEAEHLWRCGRVLALGLQMNLDTLHGGFTRSEHTFVTLRTLPSLLSAVRGPAERHIHFNPSQGEDLLPQLKLLYQKVGRYLMEVEALQVNQAWPDLKALWWWHEQFPQQRIIVPLPVNDNRATPETVLEQALDYKAAATDLFFDRSRGTGKLLDTTVAKAFLEQLLALDLGLGVAGGLEADQIGLVLGLEQQLQMPLNWDAQRRLCGPEGLDRVKAIEFLQASSQRPPR